MMKKLIQKIGFTSFILFTTTISHAYAVWGQTLPKHDNDICTFLLRIEENPFEILRAGTFCLAIFIIAIWTWGYISHKKHPSKYRKNGIGMLVCSIILLTISIINNFLIPLYNDCFIVFATFE